MACPRLCPPREIVQHVNCNKIIKMPRYLQPRHFLFSTSAKMRWRVRSNMAGEMACPRPVFYALDGMALIVVVS
jgi:hypothetical protein